MLIRFLIADAYSVGGTIRTTFMTAAELANRHEVEIVSVYRRQDEPSLELDPRVELRALADLRPGRQSRREARAMERPSEEIHPGDSRYPRFSRLTDAALLRFLRSVDDGVLVGTRPGLNLAIARHVNESVVRVGQDHMNLEQYEPALVEAMAASYGRLDTVTALTEETAQGYRKLIGPGSNVVCIPNAAPPARGSQATLGSKIVMGAGALTHRKGFDRLLRAWAVLAPEHPDWRLEIFGDGWYRPQIEELLGSLQLQSSVALRGHSSRLREELERASVFALTSRHEGFPMVLLEAMSAGLPVVAYDCPTGPRDIVTEGVDGHVVPDGRTRLLAEALRDLMLDEDRRRAFGAAAREKVERYRIDAIGERWETLFAELAAAKGPTARSRAGATRRAPA